MSPKYLVVLAIILSYTGVFLIFRKKALSFFGGLEYLFIGVLISFLNFNSNSLIPLLYPFLGWIGLLIGLQFKFNYLKGLTYDFYKKTGAYVVISFVFYSIFLYLLGFSKNSFVISIAISIISYKTVAFFLKGKSKKIRETLFFISFMPFISFILLFLIHLSIYNANGLFYFLSFTVLFSAILWFIFTQVTDKDSILLILIGFIILVSETCAIAKISPLLMGFIIGIFLTNFSKWKEFIFISLYKDEKPLYILFLLILGLTFGFSFDISVIYLTISLITLVILFNYLIIKFKYFPISNFNFKYFLTPGGLGIAIITDYWLITGASLKLPWLTSAFIAIVVLQFLVTILGERK